MIVMNLNSDRAGGLHREWSLNVVLRLCRLRTDRYRAACGRDFTVPITYFGKPDTLAILLWERTTAH
jgi:outer membrane receptor for monomeric catechols